MLHCARTLLRVLRLLAAFFTLRCVDARDPPIPVAANRCEQGVNLGAELVEGSVGRRRADRLSGRGSHVSKRRLGERRDRAHRRSMQQQRRVRQLIGG